jgi:signal transduction histidine kinase
VLVAIAARWGGQGAAIFISLATIPLVDYFLLGPQGRLDLSLRQTIQIALVLLAGLGLGWLLDNLRTARERAEASTLAERAAVGERDTLLSVIAHDLRNPLTAVRARIQLAQMALQRTPAGEAEALGSLDTAIQQVDRISRLLNDLRTTGGTNGGTLKVRLEALDLAPLVARVAERWRADATGHGFEVELDRSLPIRGDADRLEQVLDNLLANAVKYSPPESAIRMTARVLDGEVLLTVADQGAGIPPDEQAHLFERFYRRPEHRDGRQPGLGLGLYIARELVAALGGRLWVESEVGSGSSFYIALPLHADERDRPRTARASASGRQS